MKHLFKPRVCGLLLALLLLAGGTQTALAFGTPSGTVISNQATVNYQVGGIGQLAIPSDDLLGPGATTFLVDNIVNLTVADLSGGTVTVNQGSLDRVLTFSVTNTGNTPQGYQLSVVNGARAITMVGVPEIWIDDPTDPAGAGVYDTATDTLYGAGTNAGNLDPNSGLPGWVLGDETMTVFIVADTPAVAVDGDVDNYNLLAQTTDVGTANVTGSGPGNTAAGVEVVWADGQGTVDAALPDGQHSAFGSYTVGSASLTVTKSAVALDTFGTDYNIPGATVTYTIDILNSGTADAELVVVTDDLSLSTDVTWVVDSITLNGTPQTDAVDALPDTATFLVNVVTVDVGTVARSGGTATITFQVTID